MGGRGGGRGWEGEDEERGKGVVGGGGIVSESFVKNGNGKLKKERGMIKRRNRGNKYRIRKGKEMQ